MTLVKWNPNRSLISDFDRIFDNMFNIDIPIHPKESSYYHAVYDLICLDLRKKT